MEIVNDFIMFFAAPNVWIGDGDSRDQRKFHYPRPVSVQPHSVLVHVFRLETEKGML